MSKFLRSVRVISAGAAFGAVVFGAACGKKSDDLQVTKDSLALTPPPTPAVAPPIADVPSSPPPKSAPTKSTTTKSLATKTGTVTTPVVTPPANPPASPPAAPAAAYGVVASGTEFIARPSSKVCTNTQKVGDHIVATISDPVTGTAGASIPSGATADLEVTKSTFGNNDATKVALDFRVVSVSFGGHTYEVTGDVTPAEVTKVRRQSNGDQAKKVGIGAAAGAVIGRVAGGNTKSTVVGGAIGAVAGAAAAAGTADYDGCVAAESKLTVKLTQDLRVRVS